MILQRLADSDLVLRSDVQNVQCARAQILKFNFLICKPTQYCDLFYRRTEWGMGRVSFSSFWKRVVLTQALKKGNATHYANKQWVACSDTTKQFLTSCARGDTICLRAPPPASWQYLHIYSPGGTCSGMHKHQQQIDLWSLTLKVMSESRATWATSVPILVVLGLSVLDLSWCTRQIDIRHVSSLNASAIWGRGRNEP